MEPKNKKERTTSILKFAALFAVTVILILVAAFFDFNTLPFRENNVLREKVSQVEKERIYQESFSSKSEEIKSLIDSLDTPGQNIQYFNALINSKIVELQESIPEKDSTSNYNMYINSIQSYVDIQELKTKLKSYDGVDVKLEEYKQELDRITTKYNYLSSLRRR